MRLIPLAIAAGLAGLFMAAQPASALPKASGLAAGTESMVETVQMRCRPGMEWNWNVRGCRPMVRHHDRRDMRRDHRRRDWGRDHRRDFGRAPVCPRHTVWSARIGRCVVPR